jgi:hypothetical protein
MERLKKLKEVCRPDERNLNRYDRDHSTRAVTPTTIESIYAVIESIQLNDNVPDEVRSHFEIARNLALYSWFVYSFNVVAAMQAFASLEMALRDKTADRKTSFNKLLGKVFKNRRLAKGLSLAKAISKLRNDLAHGSETIHGQGLEYLSMCSELINELYPS